MHECVNILVTKPLNCQIDIQMLQCRNAWMGKCGNVWSHRFCEANSYVLLYYQETGF